MNSNIERIYISNNDQQPEHFYDEKIEINIFNREFVNKKSFVI